MTQRSPTQWASARRDRKAGRRFGVSRAAVVALPRQVSSVIGNTLDMMSKRPQVEELISYSDELLERERRTLIVRVSLLARRVSMHRDLLEQLEAELAAEQRLLGDLEELTDRRPQLRLERLDRQLRGRRLQEVAVEVLRRRRVDQAIHYREWFSLLRAEGWEVNGRDPLNTFLTELGRARNVERVGQRTGFYRLAVG